MREAFILALAIVSTGAFMGVDITLSQDYFEGRAETCNTAATIATTLSTFCMAIAFIALQSKGVIANPSSRIVASLALLGVCCLMPYFGMKRNRKTGNYEAIRILITIANLVCIVGVCTWLWYSGSQAVREAAANRVPIESSSFVEDCVVDDAGVIVTDDITAQAIADRIKPFWGATGIQPYVVAMPYQAEYEDKAALQEDVDKYFAEHVNRSDALLLAVAKSESDGKRVWAIAYGQDAAKIMDEKAQGTFATIAERNVVEIKQSLPDAIKRTLVNAADALMP